MSNSSKRILASSKLTIVDEATFNQMNQMNQKPQKSTKKYKRSRQIHNLSHFINLRSHHKITPKHKPIGYAIYKNPRKSVQKSKAKKKSKLKKCILKYRSLKPGITENIQDLSIQEDPPIKKKAVHSRRFREYCDNTTSEELNNSVEALLRKLNHFQKRAFKNNNFKGKSRRRIVIGFREIQVQLKIEKIKCVIIATDCEKCDFEDGLDNIILTIKETCRNAEIPCVFAMQRRKLAYVLNQKSPTSCVGVIDYDGAQDQYFQLIKALEVEKSNYCNLFG